MEWVRRRPVETRTPLFSQRFDGQINQIFSFTFIFRTYQAGKLVLEESKPFQLRFYSYPHLRALFRLSDLEVVAKYGSFSKTLR